MDPQLNKNFDGTAPISSLKKKPQPEIILNQNISLKSLLTKTTTQNWGY